MDAHAGDHITDRAADRDRKADGGGGADRISERYIAPEQEGNHHRSAADGYQAAQPAGEYAGQRHAGHAGQLARSMRARVKQDLCGREIHEQREEYSHKVRREAGGKHCTYAGAEQDAGSDVAHHAPVHRAVLMMFAHAGKRGEQDVCHRGAQRKMQQMLSGKVLRIEQEQQHRHQHQPAADAEQPGQESHDCAERQVGSHPFHVNRAPVFSG